MENLILYILLTTNHSSRSGLTWSASQTRYDRNQLRGIDWLGNVSAVACHYCLHAILDPGVSGQRDGGNTLPFTCFQFPSTRFQSMRVSFVEYDKNRSQNTTKLERPRSNTPHSGSAGFGNPDCARPPALHHECELCCRPHPVAFT